MQKEKKAVLQALSTVGVVFGILPLNHLPAAHYGDSISVAAWSGVPLI